MWEPPVLWNFLCKAHFLGHFEPILSQKLVKFISEKTKKMQKQQKLMFLLCFKVYFFLNHQKQFKVSFLPTFVGKNTKLFFSRMKNSFPPARGK
jgi:hypothetical protein